MREQIREVRLTPYRKGLGLPSFTLHLFDTGLMRGGKCAVGYTLVLHPGGLRSRGLEQVLFDGSDFYCSPLHAIDSDECVKALMGFLTLHIGDSDREYFEAYTPMQQAYRDEHAESLSMEVYQRFGED